MNNMNFDEYLFSRAAKEEPPFPESLRKKTEETLSSLPLRFPQKKHRPFRTVASAAACMAILLFGVLPNISVAYAAAAEDIPVIGSIVRVLTVRNYFYQDDTHELQADIPAVTDPQHAEAGALINQDIDQLTDAALNDFYARLSQQDSSYASLHIDHETLTNTDSWFTLKLTISKTEADSDLSYRFYHIDRVHGSYVTLSDLFSQEDLEMLEEKIVAQMRRGGDYWLEEEPGSTALDAEQNFYFAENGSLVIVYDKYQVGPGFMGCPEFALSPDVYEDLLDPYYATLLP